MEINFMTKNTNKNILLIFDLDDTLINGNSYYHIGKQLLSQESLSNIMKQLINSRDLILIQNFALNLIKQENISNPKFSIQFLENILCELIFNKGFHDLFQFIRNNKDKIEVMLISGSNQFFVNTILNNHKVLDLFDFIHSNPIDIKDNCEMIVKECHQHDCKHCMYGQCKRKILKEHLNKSFDKNFSYIFYIGDDINDLCPAFIMRSNDILFARKGFGIEQEIIKNDKVRKNLKCEIIFWDDATIIKNKLEELFYIVNNIKSKF